jgi:hypothetical protein
VTALYAFSKYLGLYLSGHLFVCCYSFLCLLEVPLGKKKIRNLWPFGGLLDLTGLGSNDFDSDFGRLFE